MQPGMILLAASDPMRWNTCERGGGENK